MLMGEYKHALDAKGRVILPADFRREVGESFVITKGLDTCLFLYSEEEWESLAAKLKALPLAKPEARAVVRFFFAGARTLECDRQGRFLIPAGLRKYAGLKKNIVLAGIDNRVEVWDEDAWKRYDEEITPSLAEIAGTLAEFGI